MRSEVGDQAERVPEAAVMLDESPLVRAAPSPPCVIWRAFPAIGQGQPMRRILDMPQARSAMRRGRRCWRSPQTRSRLMPRGDCSSPACLSGRPVLGRSAMSRSLPGPKVLVASPTANRESSCPSPPSSLLFCHLGQKNLRPGLVRPAHLVQMPDNWGLLGRRAAARPTNLESYLVFAEMLSSQWLTSTSLRKGIIAKTAARVRLSPRHNRMRQILLRQPRHLDATILPV